MSETSPYFVADLGDADAATADAATPAPAAGRRDGLTTFRWLRPPAVDYPAAADGGEDARPPTITLEFESAGIRRRLRAIIAPVAAIDWLTVVGGRPVSSLVHMGLSSVNSQRGADAVCGVGGASSGGGGGGGASSSSSASSASLIARPFRTIRQQVGDPLCTCAGRSSDHERGGKWVCPDAAAKRRCDEFDGCKEPFYINSWR